MTTLNFLHLALSSSGLMICITILLFTLLQGRTDKRQNKVFIIMVCIVMLNSLSGIGEAVTEGRVMDSQSFFIWYRISQYTYFLFHNALCPAFFCYVAYVCGADSKLRPKRLLPLLSLFIVTELAVLLNPLFSIVYYYDENNLFQRNWGEGSIYISAVAYFALAFSMLMFSWHALTVKKKSALIYFFFVVIFGVAAQLLYSEVKCELFCEALALMGVMIAVESEDDRIDADTGFNNRKALQTDLNSYIINRRDLYLICVKITNSDIIQRATGSDNTDILSQLVAGYLKSIVPRFYIYHTGTGGFLITVMDISEARVGAIAAEVSKRFEEPWQFGDTEFMLNAVVMAADVPGRIKSAADALYMADTPLPANLDKKILTGSDLDYLLRRAAIEDAISRGLDEGNFEVYYQPTYYLKGQRLHGAEALIRLHDSVIGNVFPDEFIPIAEQMGMIDAIDDFVLSEVCRFIESGVPIITL